MKICDECETVAHCTKHGCIPKRDFWEGYVPEPDNTCNNALRAQGKAYPRTCKKCGLGPCVELAQQALDKKAENARELGLDYEPAQPRAWFTVDELNAWAEKKLKENPQWAEQQAQQEPVWDASAPLVMTPHPAFQQPAQRTWVGLTHEEHMEIMTGTMTTSSRMAAVEAKLKEKNT